MEEEAGRKGARAEEAGEEGDGEGGTEEGGTEVDVACCTAHAVRYAAGSGSCPAAAASLHDAPAELGDDEEGASAGPVGGTR